MLTSLTKSVATQLTSILRIRSFTLKLTLVVSIGFILIAITTLIGQFLWNITMPDLIHANKISFWQLWCIFILGRMIAGGK